MASLTELRPTPKSSAIFRSAGSLSPGFKVPSSTSWCSRETMPSKLRTAPGASVTSASLEPSTSRKLAIVSSQVATGAVGRASGGRGHSSGLPRLPWIRIAQKRGPHMEQ